MKGSRDDGILNHGNKKIVVEGFPGPNCMVCSNRTLVLLITRRFVSCWSNIQALTAACFSETEHIAMILAINEWVYLLSLLEDFKKQSCFNKSPLEATIKKLSKPLKVLQEFSEQRYRSPRSFSKKAYNSKEIEQHHLSSEEQVLDSFSKPLHRNTNNSDSFQNSIGSKGTVFLAFRIDVRT